ncbi:MAG: Hsp33 family molecular chaperone HslO, partial [Balneolaceae bacterium]|nr:Hsp33 family molecular chaperone HslO [Balneolaceae bacterium]
MSLKKEEFKFNDRLIKGIEAEGRFKISVVKTTDVVQTAKKNHGLSMLNTVLLGRTLTAAMLLASELKGEERIKVQLQGNGPVGLLVAEANRVGEIRGYSQNPAAELDYSQPDVKIGDGIGLGLLTVSKTLYNEAEPRTSTIEIVEGDVLSDMAHYMVQSEQVLSAFLLDVSLKDNGDVNQAGGVLIQRLPESDESVMESLQKTVKELPSVSSMLENNQYIDSIMEKACEPFTIKELDRQPVHFFCRCSTGKFKNALSLLSYEDLKE